MFKQELKHPAASFRPPQRRRLTTLLFTLGLLTGPCLALEAGSPAPAVAGLAQYKGKTVWLDFWASWCGPCKQSFPWMNSLQQRFAAQGLQVLAVNVDSNSADAQRFLAEHPAQFAVSFDPSGQGPKAYQIKGMPTSVLIGPDGRVLWQHSGFRESDLAEMEQKIRNALETH